MRNWTCAFNVCNTDIRKIFLASFMCSSMLFFSSNCRTTSMDSQKKWAFWRADNSIGTFFLQTDIKEHVQPKAYDLRLAISNYGMFTVKETVPADPARESRLSQTLSTIRKYLKQTGPLCISSGMRSCSPILV